MKLFFSENALITDDFNNLLSKAFESYEIIHCEEKEEITRGFFFTDRFLENYSKYDLMNLKVCEQNTIFCDYSLNDGKVHLVSEQNGHLTALSPLGPDYQDGYSPVGAYYIADTSRVESITGSENFFIELMPEVERIKKKTPALFLDRDGIINEDVSYLHKVSDLMFCPGIEKLIGHFNEKGWPVICITNQSGVARGKFTTEEVNILHDHMELELAKLGAKIDHFEIAPYHFEKGVGEFKKHSVLRKPEAGMILKASRFFNIDFDKSVMVGDKNSDRIKFLNLNTFLKSTNYPVSGDYGQLISDYNEIIDLY